MMQVYYDRTTEEKGLSAVGEKYKHLKRNTPQCIKYSEFIMPLKKMCNGFPHTTEEIKGAYTYKIQN